MVMQCHARRLLAGIHGNPASDKSDAYLAENPLARVETVFLKAAGE